MRRIVVSATIVAAVLFTLAGDQAQAAGRFRSARPSRGLFNGGWQPQRSSGGFLSNLMDVERRKNQWLRSTFFGR